MVYQTELTKEQTERLANSIAEHCLMDRGFLWDVCYHYAATVFDFEEYSEWFNIPEEAKV